MRQTPTPAPAAANAAKTASQPILGQNTPSRKKVQLPPLLGATKDAEKASKLIKEQNAKRRAEAKEAEKEFARQTMKQQIIEALGENKILYEKHINDNNLNRLFRIRGDPEELKEAIINAIKDENEKFKLKQPRTNMKLSTLIKMYQARSNNKKGEVRELIISKLAPSKITNLISASSNIPSELVQAALIRRIESFPTITNKTVLRSLRTYVNGREVNNRLKQLVNKLVPPDKSTTQKAFKKAFEEAVKKGSKPSKGTSGSVLKAARRHRRELVSKQANALRRSGQTAQAKKLEENEAANARRRTQTFTAGKSRRSARQQVLNDREKNKSKKTPEEQTLEEMNQLINEIYRTMGGNTRYPTTPSFATRLKT